MADSAFIENFYSRHKALYDHLVEKKELTFATDMNTTFARSLLLAIASFFEHEVTEKMKRVPVVHAKGHPFITAMIERQVITRKYHTWFDWDDLKAGTFFSLFGEEFKKAVNAKLKAEPASGEAMKAFLELGQMRNSLVHQNYVQFEVTKTPEDLIEQFRVALRFMDFLDANIFPPKPLVDGEHSAPTAAA